MNHLSGIDALRSYLSALQPGPVPDAREVESLLAACWDDLSGSDAESMSAEKLIGRIAQVEWNPPMLSFVIERHGGTVKGSSRAAVHSWKIDVAQMKAYCSVAGHRQLKPMSPRLDMAPLVSETVDLICSGQSDPRLKWRTDDEVRILVGKIVVAETLPRQTIEGRRRRFWAALDEQLQRQGWQGAGRGTYRRKADA